VSINLVCDELSVEEVCAAFAGRFRLEEHPVWSVHDLEHVDVDDFLDFRGRDGARICCVRHKELPLLGGGSWWGWPADCGVLWCNSDLASLEVAVHGFAHQGLRVVDILLGDVETESRVALAGSHDDGW